MFMIFRNYYVSRDITCTNILTKPMFFQCIRNMTYIYLMYVCVDFVGVTRGISHVGSITVVK